MRRPLELVAPIALATVACAQARVEVRVHTADELRRAAETAKPGTTILLAPGEHAGGIFLANLRGEEGRPIVIAGEGTTAKPTVLRGGSDGLHLANVEHVVIRDLEIRGASGNGINVDDGGKFDRPSHDIVLRRLTVTDVGPQGNCDAIKLSGLADFRVEGCTVERWGSGGSAIDMVGCHRGAIEGCTFHGNPSAGADNGVQTKGGSSDIAIRRNRFEDAGSRAVNLGGSTDLRLFRPPLGADEHFEARDVRVEGNQFIGGETPVAFVGALDSTFRFNTVYAPRKWVLRILQETREPGFAPCGSGVFSDNVVAFRSDAWSEGGVNVGSGTAPASFTFARNVWFCVDDPGRSGALVRLPAPETDGRPGLDPLFRDATKGDLRLREGSPAANAGFEALPR